MATQPFDGLALLKRVDTWPYYQQNPSAYKAWMADYYYFMIQGYPRPFGYMHKSILSGLNLSSAWVINHSERLLTMNLGESFHDRTQIMRATLSQAVKEGAPTSPQKFYDESLCLVPATGEHVLDLDRSGLDPFGVVSFSAHVIGYVKSGDETRY